jgi:hypothetical protein
MRDRLTLILVWSCFGALFLISYGPTLVRDHQFAFRDTGSYYYWLNKRVQAEWNAGRWPLWEPEENAGMPLLGNPTAAVLYPGKAVFAILPYAWGARAYVLVHSALAFVTMLVLMRSWHVSRTGSALSAMAYAFSGPILFQYTNIIYLIGAAWLPLGVHAADQWVRLGRRWGLAELAIVLSMQMLGGEPQAAYVLGVASVGYASGLAWSRARAASNKHPVAQAVPSRRWFLLPVAGIALVFWCAATLALAQWMPKLRGSANPRPPLPWMAWVPFGVIGAWCLMFVGILFNRQARGWRYFLRAMWLGLAASAMLAGALTAAQLVPVIEFTQRTGRTHAGPDEVYEFTVEPSRLFELAWPNVTGVPLGGNEYWGDAIKMPGIRPKGWVPTLYMGGLMFALAVSSLAIRRGPPWRVWLTVVAWISLLASLGQYTSPIWAARALAVMSRSDAVHDWLHDLGPFDPMYSAAIRHDGYLRDSDGGVYWWLMTVLPGFRQFRYPAKLFTFSTLAMAALAGWGWDQLEEGRGRSRRASFVFFAFVALTVSALAVVVFQREPILASLRALKTYSDFGPLDAGAAYRATVRSLGHATIVFVIGLVLTFVIRRSAWLARATALILTTADLAAANSWHVLTVPQSMLETKPELMTVIEDAERNDRSNGPYRVHRMYNWHPVAWGEKRSKDRVVEYASWERDTLAPKYGIDYGLEYTHTIGVAQLADYERFFASFYMRVQDTQVAKTLGVEPGVAVVYFSRRAYDMWNTRYVIVPYDTNGWRDPQRASTPFLFQTNQIYPNSGEFAGPGGTERARTWAETRDVRVLRNLQELPRAWVVHDAFAADAVSEPFDGNRNKPIQEFLYAGDPIWNETSQRVHDPHRIGWMRPDDLTVVRRYLSGQPPTPSETVNVTYPSPQETILDVSLDSPGLVILADVEFPGWELKVDGESAPIYRVNGMMRGAAVSAGPHRLVYTYAPQSFLIGRLVSIAGLVGLFILGLACRLWPVDPIIVGNPWTRPEQEQPPI